MAFSNTVDPKFEALLDHVKRARAFDFSGYKRSSLMRRVRKRMQAVGIDDFTDYMDYLEVHSDEFAKLFNTILINVSSFFRDPESWNYLDNQVIAKIIESNPEGSIRVWSAGCAAGQEPYSIAILLYERLGAAEFQRRVKIYATDVDEDALAQARQAVYERRDLDNVPEKFLERYFIEIDGRFMVKSELRRAVIFGRHDLVQDSPISHIDLLTCRNTLMYMNAETQTRILNRLHFALKDSGYLFLGKAEMLVSHSSLFAQVDLQHRIFRKIYPTSLRTNLLTAGQGISQNWIGSMNGSAIPLMDIAFDSLLVAQIVVDSGGHLRWANKRSEEMFSLTKRDIGRQFQDLELSYRPLDLRSLIDQAHSERRAISQHRVTRRLPQDVIQNLSVEVTPLFTSGEQPAGTSITFEDVTEVFKLHEELQSAHEILETTNEELQSTNEELETTNEELQSTNEELETTNEELQSSNEELETMNEELRSSNEELEATHAGLKALTRELNDNNIFLESILSSIRFSVVVLSRDMKVVVWNERAQDLWGLRQDEVAGRDFFSLDIGFPVVKLRETLENLSDGKNYLELFVPARNRRGQDINCKVVVTTLHDHTETGSYLLMMQEV